MIRRTNLLPQHILPTVILLGLILAYCQDAHGQEPLPLDAVKDSVTLKLQKSDKPNSLPVGPEVLHAETPEYNIDGSSEKPPLGIFPSINRPLFYNPLTGLLFQHNEFAVYGFGRQQEILGIGKINEAYLKYRYSSGQRLLTGIGIYANKVNMPPNSSQTFAIDTDISYRFNSNLSAMLFGSYYWMNYTGGNSTKWLNGYHFGGSVMWDITPKWGLEAGARCFGNSQNSRPTVMPVLKTTYKNNNREINADFSGAVQQLLLGIFSNN